MSGNNFSFLTNKDSQQSSKKYLQRQEKDQDNVPTIQNEQKEVNRDQSTTIITQQIEIGQDHQLNDDHINEEVVCRTFQVLNNSEKSGQDENIQIDEEQLFIFLELSDYPSLSSQKEIKNQQESQNELTKLKQKKPRKKKQVKVKFEQNNAENQSNKKTIYDIQAEVYYFDENKGITLRKITFQSQSEYSLDNEILRNMQGNKGRVNYSSIYNVILQYMQIKNQSNDIQYFNYIQEFLKNVKNNQPTEKQIGFLLFNENKDKFKNYFQDMNQHDQYVNEQRNYEEFRYYFTMMIEEFIVQYRMEKNNTNILKLFDAKNKLATIRSRLEQKHQIFENSQAKN